MNMISKYYLSQTILAICALMLCCGHAAAFVWDVGAPGDLCTIETAGQLDAEQYELSAYFIPYGDALYIDEKTALPVTVSPTLLSNKSEVSDETGIYSSNLVERYDLVYLKKNYSEKIAEALLSQKSVKTKVLPIFKGAATLKDQAGEVSFTMTGLELLALYPEQIKLIGMVSGGAMSLFDYIDDANDARSGTFTLRYGGEIYSGEIDPEKYYELVAFIMDGGIFDLDGQVNGELTAAIFLAEEKSRDSDIFGCNAGFGFLLVLLGALMVKNRRQRFER
jgi:hypothetical protein